jgi:hypothetical protein
MQLALAACLATMASDTRAADAQPPTVTITQPANGATLSRVIQVSANATDDVGVAAVTFKLDGASVAPPVTSPPFIINLATTRFVNGIHTLLAIASDAAGNTARSALIQITVTNPLAYTLGTGPFVLEDLGSVLSANTQEKQIMFKATNDDLHLILYYYMSDLSQFASNAFQILDVNCTSNTWRLTDAVLGRPGPTATAKHPNGNIYIGSGSPSYLFEYNPITGATNFISKLTQRNAQYIDIGDDGWVYVGEESWGVVDRYDPVTETFERLGQMDPSNTNDFYQYAYTLGSDGRYLYSSLGEHQWYLSILDLQTRKVQLHFRTNGDPWSTVYRGKAGGLYYWRNTSTNGILWYQLTNGQPVAIASTPAVYEYYEHGGVVTANNFFPARFNTEINLDDAYPDGSNTNAIIRYRTVGETNWQSITANGFRLSPSIVRRIYSLDNTQLFGWTDLYGPVFSYNLISGQTTILGRLPYSLYDSTADGTNLFLSGYPSATLQYPPTQPWTFNTTLASYGGQTVNPNVITNLSVGKYHYYSTMGADGLLYIGGAHERDSIGGEIGWYDPITRSNGSLRSPFLNYNVRDLKPALGGTKLVYSSDRTNLLVFDVARKSIERIVIPWPTVSSALDKIVEVSPAIMLGATDTRIFKVDIRDGSVLYTNTLPGQAFGGGAIPTYNHRLVLGPDGYVWMFIGNSLYRIDPGDCSLTRVLDTPAKSLLFKERDLYLYGGPNLYRIHNLLVTTVAPPGGLHLLPSP